MKKLFVTLAAFALAAGVMFAQDYNAAVDAFNAGAQALETNKVEALAQFRTALTQAQACEGEEAAELVAKCKEIIPGTLISIAKEQINEAQYDEALVTLVEANTVATEYGAEAAAKEAGSLIANTYLRKGSTLLKAGTGVNFELYDSVGGGEITYDAMLSDKPGTFYMDIRNILEVNGGTFTMNGGYIHAGRKELFKARDGERTRLVNGNAIIVGPKSSIYIHAGKIESTGSYFWHELPEHKLNTIEVFDNYAQACAVLNLSMYSHASEYYGVEELMADSSTTVVIDDCEMVSLDSLCYRTMLNVKENLIIRGGSFSALVNRKYVYYGNSASEDIYAYSFAYSGLPLKALDLDKYKIWVGDAIHTNHYTVKAHYITKEETIIPKIPIPEIGLEEVPTRPAI